MKHHIFTIFALLVLSLLPAMAQETDAAFPVTIEHKFGSITLEERPERVVSIGYTEQDTLLALGVTPVAVRYWYGDQDSAIFPWAQDEAAGAEPIVLNMPFGALNYEAILALEPDLISAVGSGITAEEYENLSQIAPTLAQYDEYVDFGMPWQERVRLIGQAVGENERAEQIVGDLEARYDEIREQYPQFEGQTVAVAYRSRGTYGYYTGQDSRGRFFTDLGFVVPERLNEIAGENFYADISEERVDLLDQDLLVFLALQFAEDGSEAARDAIGSDPLIQQLDATQADRVLFISDEYDDALQFSTVLSLDFLLDNLVPEIAEVMPANTAAESSTGAVGACAEGEQRIVHSLGESCVPEDVERVVTLEWTYTENVLALGVQPVGVADIAGYMDWVDIPLELAEDVADVGTRQEPNLEQIALLDPDLIITATLRLNENYEQLNAIAPTLAFNAYPTDISHYDEMVTTFNTIADALNREEEAANVLDELQAAYDRVAEAIRQADITNDTFILAQSFLSGESPVFRLFTDNAMAVQILERVGLANAWEDVPGPFGFSTVDFEGFAGIDDTNFFYIAQPTDQAAITDAPVWDALPFVQNDHAYWLGGDVWLFGGPLSAVTLLDTVTDALPG
jgi:iron complex transport system substrate-binding protein